VPPNTNIIIHWEVHMFNSIIEEYMISNPRPRWKRTNDRHWPSEASCVMPDGSMVGKCLREKYFDNKSYPPDKEIAPRIQRIMDVGKAIEQSEIERAKNAGIWIADDVGFQMEISDGIIVSGKLDAIYKDSDNNEVCVEYKTSSGYTFEKEVYGKFNRAKANPKPEHILQVMIYLEAMKQIPYAIIYYVNRDKMDIMEHEVRLDGGYAIVNGDRTEFNIVSIYDRYILMSEYLNNDQMPPCDYCPIYPVDDIDDMMERGDMYKSTYTDWLDNGVRPGDGRCKYLCSYKATCLNYQGDTDDVSGAIVDL